LFLQITTTEYACIEFSSYEYNRIFALTNNEIEKDLTDADDGEWQKLKILANKLAKDTLSVMNTILNVRK